MCGRKRDFQPATETGEVYEGQTTRLKAGGTCGGGFPWWTLWLIWPLIGVGKALSAAVISGWASFSQWTVPVPTLLAVGLMVIGAVLLLRGRMR